MLDILESPVETSGNLFQVSSFCCVEKVFGEEIQTTFFFEPWGKFSKKYGAINNDWITFLSLEDSQTWDHFVSGIKVRDYPNHIVDNEGLNGLMKFLHPDHTSETRRNCPWKMAGNATKQIDALQTPISCITVSNILWGTVLGYHIHPQTWNLKMNPCFQSGSFWKPSLFLVWAGIRTPLSSLE